MQTERAISQVLGLHCEGSTSCSLQRWHSTTSKNVLEYALRGRGMEPALIRDNQGSRVDGGPLMMDLLFLLVVIGFFAGAIAYVEGCERL